MSGLTPARSWWPRALLLAILTFAAYIPAIRAGYVWDDHRYATDPLLDEPGGLSTIWTLKPSPEFYYRDVPLVYTTFWLERRLWKSRPMGFHLANVALHVLNALLVWFLLRRLGLGWAWFAAAVFALHPVNVESVAWITELKNTQSGLFFLLAIAGYLYYEDGGGPGCYAAALAAFALSLLSKPVTATLPVVLALLSWAAGSKLDKRAAFRLAPFFALSLAAGLATIFIETNVVGEEMQRTLFHFSWTQHLLWACRALWFYPLKLVWPADLAFSYGRWNLDPRNPFQWFWVVATAAAAGLCWHYKDNVGRGALAALGYYVVMIAPMLGVASVYTFRYALVADHYQYLACIGIIALGVGTLSRWDREEKTKAAFTAAVLCLLGVATWRQCRVYADEKTLWEDTLRKTPDSALAHTNLAGILANEGKPAQSIEHYQQALRLEPDDLEALQDLGVAYSKAGRLEEAKALFQEAVRLQPKFYPSLLSLADVYQAQGNYNEAITTYQAALRVYPDYPEALYDLGNAYYKTHKLEDARRLFESALRLKPDIFQAQNNLGNVLADEGKLDEAAAHYQAALQLQPSFVPAYVNLANTLVRLNRREQAQQAYEAAIRLAPDLAIAYRNLGLLLLQEGKKAEAQQRLDRANQLEHQ